MLHKILPPKINGLTKKLDINESSLCPYYISAYALFKWSINIDQFINALEKTLHQIDFLFCRLSVKDGAVWADYLPESEEYSVTLEVETAHLNLSELTETISFLMPQLIDKRVTSIVDTKKPISI